jgi:predicted AlkP superfamily pyrophosphatase or phosphodiesterase
MQMLVEGLAMGAFSTFYKFGRDPVMVKLMQLVMTDEAFHHKFGKIWADKTIPKLNKEERDSIEDWAWEVFHVLLFNLVSPDQKKHIYEEVGIDWQWAQSIMMEAATDENLREEMLEATNIFRVLVKTLLKAGIITERTAGNYAAFVDIQELYKEGDWMVGDDIAEEGIKQLIRINGGSNKFLGLDGLLAAE